MWNVIYYSWQQLLLVNDNFKVSDNDSADMVILNLHMPPYGLQDRIIFCSYKYIPGFVL